MALSDVQVRNAKHSPKTQRLWDEYGLYLEIAPTKAQERKDDDRTNLQAKSQKAKQVEGKWWRLKYRYAGKEKRLALGSYSTMSLQDARTARDDAKKLLRTGIDPGVQKQHEKRIRTDRAGSTFEIVAREWHAKQSKKWVPAHSKRVMDRLERDLFPRLGSRPISEITAPELLAVLRRIESRGVLETTRRAKGDCGMVFRYAIASGVLDAAAQDPSSSLSDALTPVKGKHFAARTKPDEVAEILRKLDTYAGTPTVRAMLRLQAMLFCRPGELRQAEWKDIDLIGADWRYLASKTKSNHIVPLSRQALTILLELRPITGLGRLVFPSPRKPIKPMSDAAANKAMRSVGIPRDAQTGHGWRATARTLLAEELKFPPHLIEHQLAHAVKDANGEAYNRTSFLPERRAMMQKWSDYCDSLKNGSDQRVIVGHFGAA